MQSIHKKSFAAEQLRRQRKKSPVTIAIVVLAVVIAVGAVGYALYVRYSTKETPIKEVVAPEKEKKKSIAVLSFVDLSPEKDQEWFCDGIAEAIIGALSHVEGFHVISRNSAFTFKGEHRHIGEIGEKLKVETVLEGSVQKVGNRLRISAQLINVADDSHLWSNNYNRELEDVFAIQDEISLKIAEALKGTLLGKEKKAIAKRYTDNLDAYEMYTRGRWFWNKRTEDGLKRAIELFQKAIEKDPNYSLAYAGFADCFCLLSFYSDTPPAISYSRARETAMKALEIDGSLAQAHTALAYVKHRYDWDWDSIEQEYKHALELNPNYATAHQWYGEYLLTVGRFDEAIESMKRAMELDPVSMIINSLLGLSYVYTQQLDLAIMQLNKTLEMDPNFSQARIGLGFSYSEKGLHKEAIEEFKKARDSSGGSTNSLANLGFACGRAGKHEEAKRLLEELKNRSKQQYISPFHIASIYVGLGDKDKAFEYLEKAYEERYESLVFLKVSPTFDALRSDPRFSELLKKMGLPED